MEPKSRFLPTLNGKSLEPHFLAHVKYLTKSNPSYLKTSVIQRVFFHNSPLRVIQDLMNNPPSAAFVATLGHQVVGIFVANREACGGDEVARIRSEFHVEDFIAYDRHRPRNQALLTALALNPIFAGHCRFALKEVKFTIYVLGSVKLYGRYVCWSCPYCLGGVEYIFLQIFIATMVSNIDSTLYTILTRYECSCTLCAVLSGQLVFPLKKCL